MDCDEWLVAACLQAEATLRYAGMRANGFGANCGARERRETGMEDGNTKRGAALSRGASFSASHPAMGAVLSTRTLADQTKGPRGGGERLSLAPIVHPRTIMDDAAIKTDRGGGGSAWVSVVGVFALSFALAAIGTISPTVAAS